VNIQVHPAEPSMFSVCLRIPQWCRDFKMRVNNRIIHGVAHADGYVHISRFWRPADTVDIDLAMPVERIIAHPFANGLCERAVIQRGPIVYCLEGVDNLLVVVPILPSQPVFSQEYLPGLLGGIVRITTRNVDGTLLTLNPYYTWDNRPAVSKASDWLRVWLRQQDWYALRAELDGGQREAWEHVLYQPVPFDPTS